MKSLQPQLEERFDVGLKGPIDTTFEDQVVQQRRRLSLLNWVGEHDEAREMHHREPYERQPRVPRWIGIDLGEDRLQVRRGGAIADGGDDRKDFVSHQGPRRVGRDVPVEYNEPLPAGVQSWVHRNAAAVHFPRRVRYSR